MPSITLQKGILKRIVATFCSDCKGGQTTSGFINATFTIKDDTLILSRELQWVDYVNKLIYRINKDTLHLKLIKDTTRSFDYFQDSFVRDTVFVKLPKECYNYLW